MKKVYILLSLIILISNSKFSFCMQPDFDDPEYKGLKQELFEAVQKNNPIGVETKFGNIIELLANKFIKYRHGPSSKAHKFKKTFDHFHKVLEPQYIQNLLYDPKGNSIMEEALKKQNFSILYLLFKKLGADSTVEEYLKYINDNPIKLEDDKLYMNIKTNLIDAVKGKSSKDVNDLLINDFYSQIRSKYIDNKLITNIEDRDKIQMNYRTKIKPRYSIDLLETLIPLATSNNNQSILYIILHQLFEEERYIGPYITLVSTKSFISPLLELQTQPIYDKVDFIVISCINNLIQDKSEDHVKNLLEFLKSLREDVVDNIRFADILVRALYYSTSSQEEINSIIEELHKNNLIKNPDAFKAYSENYTTLLDIIHTVRNNQNISQAIQSARSLSREFINKKDDSGNSLLINIINQTRQLNDIPSITSLIRDLNADVNQPGDKGQTPLIHALFHLRDEKVKRALVKSLLKMGADAAAQDMFGVSALDYAHGDVEIISLLTKDYKKSKLIKMPIQEQIMALTNLNSTLNSLINKA